MVTIKPFDGYLANPDRANEIVCPSYDAMTPHERHDYANAHPRNYLNAMRALEEFSQIERPSLDDLLARNAACLERMIAQGDLQFHARQCFYIYRLVEGSHVQVGVVAEVPVEDYEKGLIKKHENTQEDKEDDLTAYQRGVRASSSPICLAYRSVGEIDVFVERFMEREPIIHFTPEDGLVQTVWQVGDQDDIDTLCALFAGVPAAYLTDGHHRAASAVRFVASERAANPAHTGDEPYNNLLVGFYPDNQLRILEYNRCVKGMNGLGRDELLSAMAPCFTVERLAVESAREALPRARGEVAMVLGSDWYRLRVRPEIVPRDDPVGRLDVTVLQERLLGPVLGINDPRTSHRIEYLSAAFDLDELASICRQSEEIGFAVYPTSIEDLIAVSDAGEVMPPKSTWFDPKLRAGLFLRMR